LKYVVFLKCSTDLIAKKNEQEREITSLERTENTSRARPNEIGIYWSLARKRAAIMLTKTNTVIINNIASTRLELGIVRPQFILTTNSCDRYKMQVVVGPVNHKIRKFGSLSNKQSDINCRTYRPRIADVAIIETGIA
jgi:hypothetical protein